MDDDEFVSTDADRGEAAIERAARAYIERHPEAADFAKHHPTYRLIEAARAHHFAGDAMTYCYQCHDWYYPDEQHDAH